MTTTNPNMQRTENKNESWGGSVPGGYGKGSIYVFYGRLVADRRLFV